jgi:membrane-bound ClpP family serine protease
MTEEHARSHLQLGSFNERASASTLMQRSNGSSASGAGDGAAARRLFVMGVLGAVALLVVVVGLVSVFASGALPWLVGTIVVVATVGVVVLGLHAGGHGWFVPLPVLVLAGAWALTGSAGNWTSGVAWTLAALAFISAALAAVLIIPAIAYRHAPATAIAAESLMGADGTTLSPLAPTGIVRVNKETWTAESLSGPLPAGAPIHVVRVEGVRLLVWSEAGSVPGQDALGFTNQEKEER